MVRLKGELCKEKNMKPSLLVLAAGLGSRYGGVKQIDPVGTHGEAASVAARGERQHSPAEPIRHRGEKRLQRGAGDAPHAQSSGQRGRREAEGPLDHQSDRAGRREGVIAGQSSPEHL